jgi:DNA polymerase-3 subunit alpha
VKTHVQKNGKPMAFVDMEDMFGKLSCVFFGSIYARYASFLKPDSMVLIEGTVRMREEEPSIIASTLMIVE